MSKTTEQLSPPADSTEKVKRVRDLIFGQQIRNYDQKFVQLTQDVQRLQGELNRITTQLHDQEARLLQQLREQTSQQNQRLHELEERLLRQLQEFNQAHVQSAQELRQDLRHTEESLRLDLREAVQQLADQKADRRSLGDKLIELGTLLQNQDTEQIMVDLLDELGSALE